MKLVDISGITKFCQPSAILLDKDGMILLDKKGTLESVEVLN